jgi:hypothetical protein
MENLRAEYSIGCKTRVLAELRPFLTGGVGLPSQEEVATRLGVPLETLRSHLFRLRSRYRALLRAEVLRTTFQEDSLRCRAADDFLVWPVKCEQPASETFPPFMR